MTVIPNRLEPGDLVALVSPAGPVDAARVAHATGTLAGWGLKVRVGPHALDRTGFLAGSDEDRLADLNDALRDPSVRGVLCLRGGYGLQRIVDAVDYRAVRDDPKLVLGFSDVTALHLGLWAEARLATVHGPNAGLIEETARHALMSGQPVTVEGSSVVVPGRASGVLLGGNLTILAATAGTPHAPDTRGAVLLVEDVGEAAYRVDRALVQLARAGWLSGVRGVAVGQFTRCGPAVEDVLADRLGRLGVPVLGGLPIGHEARQVAVGLGVPAMLDTEARTLTVAPPAR